MGETGEGYMGEMGEGYMGEMGAVCPGGVDLYG